MVGPRRALAASCWGVCALVAASAGGGAAGAPAAAGATAEGDEPLRLEAVEPPVLLARQSHSARVRLRGPGLARAARAELSRVVESRRGAAAAPSVPLEPCDACRDAATLEIPAALLDRPAQLRVAVLGGGGGDGAVSEVHVRVAAPARLSRVQPAEAPITGGATLTLLGDGFERASDLALEIVAADGHAALARARFVSAREVHATLPMMAPPPRLNHTALRRGETAAVRASVRLVLHAAHAAPVPLSAPLPAALTLRVRAPVRVSYLFLDEPLDLGWTHNWARARSAVDARFGGYVASEAVAHVPPEAAAAAASARARCRAGADLVVGTTFGHSAGIEAAAAHADCAAAGTRFVQGGFHEVSAGVAVLYTKIYEHFYLAGVLAGAHMGAAMASQTVGFVVGFPLPFVLANVNAFALGCLAANARCDVRVLWLGAWSDGWAERAAASKLWVEDGARLVAQHTDTLEAQRVFAADGPPPCDALPLDAEHGRPATCMRPHEVARTLALPDRGASIGANIDARQLLGDSVLSSVLLEWAPGLEHFVRRVLDDTWVPGERWYHGVEEGVNALAPTSARAHAAAARALEAAAARLRAGGSARIFCGVRDAQRGGACEPTPPLDDDDAGADAERCCLGDAEVQAMGFLVRGVRLAARTHGRWGSWDQPHAHAHGGGANLSAAEAAGGDGGGLSAARIAAVAPFVPPRRGDVDCPAGRLKWWPEGAPRALCRPRCASGAYDASGACVDVYASLEAATRRLRAALGALLALLCALGAGALASAAAARWRRKEARRLARDEWVRAEVSAALAARTSLQFPLHVVSLAEFARHGRLEPYEALRARGAHAVFDSVGSARAYLRHKRLIFITHQWLSWAEPDCAALQYAHMVAAARAVARLNEWEPHQVVVWVDYLCVPQAHAKLQDLAVQSLAYYAALAHALLCVAPAAVHRDTGQVCDRQSYLRRMWCRAEHLCFALSNGSYNMFVAECEGEEAHAHAEGRHSGCGAELPACAVTPTSPPHSERWSSGGARAGAGLLAGAGGARRGSDGPLWRGGAPPPALAAADALRRASGPSRRASADRAAAVRVDRVDERAGSSGDESEGGTRGTPRPPRASDAAAAADEGAPLEVPACESAELLRRAGRKPSVDLQIGVYGAGAGAHAKPPSRVSDEWLDTCLAVFEGESTCCARGHVVGGHVRQMCDKEQLVRPLLGLYGELFRANLERQQAEAAHAQQQRGLQRGGAGGGAAGAKAEAAAAAAPAAEPAHSPAASLPRPSVLPLLEPAELPLRRAHSAGEAAAHGGGVDVPGARAAAVGLLAPDGGRRDGPGTPTASERLVRSLPPSPAQLGRLPDPLRHGHLLGCPRTAVSPRPSYGESEADGEAEGEVLYSERRLLEKLLDPAAHSRIFPREFAFVRPDGRHEVRVLFGELIGAMEAHWRRVQHATPALAGGGGGGGGADAVHAELHQPGGWVRWWRRSVRWRRAARRSTRSSQSGRPSSAGAGGASAGAGGVGSARVSAASAASAAETLRAGGGRSWLTELRRLGVSPTPGSPLLGTARRSVAPSARRPPPPDDGSGRAARALPDSEPLGAGSEASSSFKMAARLYAQSAHGGAEPPSAFIGGEEAAGGAQGGGTHAGGAARDASPPSVLSGVARSRSDQLRHRHAPSESGGGRPAR